MLLNTSTDAVLMQVTDCYSEPHMFVEVSELQPWVILSLNAGALKTTGETDPSFVSSRLPLLGKSVRLLCDMEQPSQALGNPALVIQSFLRPQKRLQWRAMAMPFSLSLLTVMADSYGASPPPISSLRCRAGGTGCGG